MRRRCRYSFYVSVLIVLTPIFALSAAGQPVAPERLDACGRLNVRQFADHVVDGDWAPAIQAAIDSVSRENGFNRGATIFLPPRTYRIDDTIIIGTDPGQYGLHLLGYGAVLHGSAALDARELRDPEPEEAEAGLPVILLKTPGGHEGASYVLEGFTVTRENRRHGTGIAVGWDDVPKNTTFRNVNVHAQKIGIHIPYAWQFRFRDCVLRSNDIGMQMRSHANNVLIDGCSFRRNHHHGLVIGPDRGQWASNSSHISGCIFEANKGYGLLLQSSGEAVVTGNYFEANGNGIGVFTHWRTTIDTNFFWGYYGHSWRQTPYADDAHIVIGGQNIGLRLRNNQYREVTAWFRRPEEGERWEYVPHPEGPSGVKQHEPRPPEKKPGFVYEERPVGIMVVGTIKGRHVFDAAPAVGPGAKITTERIAADTGLAYFEYDAATNRFVEGSVLD
ncbi:MAG: right-handed parallel beta-helix repeat-containing protein [Armatimonadota bacterium]